MRKDNGKLLLGAVAYDPKVVTIWDGFKLWFEKNGLSFDYVLYSNYERQVEAHLAGHVDVTWNSPLAWIQTERLAARLGRQARAFAMRDSDRDLRSVVLVRADSGILAPGQLAGRTVAVGAADSPQATLIPLLHLQRAGLRIGEDITVQRHDLLVGKHGDHIGGEREAVRALLDGRADAACIIDANQLTFSAEGTIPAGALRAVAVTDPYDHCVFTAIDGGAAQQAQQARIDTFRSLLLQMDYGDPEVRPLLDMEGLKVWKEGRVSGFEQLDAAVDALDTAFGDADGISAFLDAAEARLRA